MAKSFRPQVITANDLVEGDAVFLGAIGWVRDIAEARVAQTPEDAEMLEVAAAQGETDNLVVGPYLVEVRIDAGRPEPILRREQIRASRAPTIAVGPAAEIAKAA